MKKRICTLLLALCLTLGLLPAAAQAAGDGSGTFDTVRWTLDADGGLTVSGTGDLPDGAFAGRTDIVTVTFTGQVARIGRSAFAGCTQLRRVDGFGAVTCVMSRAFAGCTALTELAVPGTVAYLRICFLGVPLITAYNIIASIFRGLGDSKRPMYFIAIACAANIALDYLFMGALHMGPAGAALGTTLAQAVSVVVSLLVIRRERDGIALTRGDFRPQRAVMGRILRIGVPVALQDGLIQIAFLFITVIANRRGLTDAAAVGIVEKIISFLFLVPSSMLSTVSALGAQCIGAGKPRRALQTLWYAIAIAFGFGVLITIVIQFVAEPVVSLFTDSAAVAAAGGQYLRGYILDCCFAGLHFCFSGYFCAIGRSELSFLHNITAVVLVPGAYLMSKWFPTTLLPMGLATAAGSLLSVIICVIAFLVLRRRGRLVPEEA